MPNLNTTQLSNDMVSAIQNVLKGHWKLAKPYAETEAKKLAETAALIERGKAKGDINEQQAKILVRMQADASMATLTALEGIGMIAAQDAINSAIDVLRKAVNAATRVAIL